jgi:hypothetical protein
LGREGAEIVDTGEVSAVTSLLVSQLSALSWLVRKSRISKSGPEPDVVITRPDGTKYVVEVQEGDRKPRFGELARVDNLASEVRASSEGVVHTILVTDQEVSPSVGEAAQALGVEIVEVSGTVENIASTVAGRLLEIDSQSDDGLIQPSQSTSTLPEG